MIKDLHKETNWNIIITCMLVPEQSMCPIIPNFPVNRIIPLSSERSFNRRLKSSVLNPNFNQFKLFNSMEVKRKAKLSKCLANKTVYLVTSLSLKLLENVVLIRNNLKQEFDNYTRAKIILYSERNRIKEFWDNFMKKMELMTSNTDSVSIALHDTLPSMGSNTRDEVYVLGERYGFEFPCNHNTIHQYQILVFLSESSETDSLVRFKNRCGGRISIKMETSREALDENLIQELLSISY